MPAFGLVHQNVRNAHTRKSDCGLNTTLLTTLWSLPIPSLPLQPSSPRVPFSSPQGQSLLQRCPSPLFYQNENVQTADCRGHWENQFSFRWETFVFALWRSAKVWQQSLALKGKCANKGWELVECGRDTQWKRGAAWGGTLLYVGAFAKWLPLKWGRNGEGEEKNRKSRTLLINYVRTTRA